MNKGIFTAILLLALATVPLAAQDPAIVRPTTGGFIVDFENQDIRAVINALADAGGLNVSVVGNVPNNIRPTLRLTTPISREEIPAVLQSIVEQNGFRLTITEGGLYMIDRPPAQGRGNQPAQPLNPLDLGVYTIQLRHQNNVVLAQILTAVFTQGGGRGGGGINFQNLLNAGRQQGARGGGAAGARGGGAGGGGAAGGRGGRGGGGDDALDPATAAALTQFLLDPAASLTGIYDPATVAELVNLQNPDQLQDIRIRAMGALGMDPNANVQQQGQGRGGGGLGAVGEQIATLFGGGALQALQGAGGAGAAAQQQQAAVPVFVPMDGTNQLIVRATPADFALIEALVAAVDLRPLQVLIEVSIVEVRRSEDLNVGISGSGSYTKQGDTDPRASATLARPSTFDNARDFVFQLTGGRGTVDFNLALNALATRGDVRVASLPVIVAQNNRQAQLIVGEQRPFIQTTQLNETGTINSIVQYRDVATTLFITPTINADGYVNMDVDQAVQDVTSEVQFDAPIISSRRAVTSLFVRTGQTAVIGGLASTRSDKTRTGIPFLSRIPIIGAIFGATRNSDVVTELYLFLTPHVIEGDQDTDRIREAVRSQSDVLRDVPLRQIIQPQQDPAIRVIIPPDTAAITRIPQRVDTLTTSSIRNTPQEREFAFSAMRPYGGPRSFATLTLQ